MTITAADAYNFEITARRAFEAGNLPLAMDEYQRAADAWGAIADRLARHGETLVASTFRQEQRRAQRKADAVIWYA